jgi:hypothetical protein
MGVMTKDEINTLVYKYIGVDENYLRGFSYSQHERFCGEFCDLSNIDVPAVRQRCGSTKNSFLDILEKANPLEQARITRGDAPFNRLADRLVGNVVGAAIPLATTDTVQRAVADAEALIRTRGPISAVDRLHTVLHGHLLHLCREAGITLGKIPQ